MLDRMEVISLDGLKRPYALLIGGLLLVSPPLAAPAAAQDVRLSGVYVLEPGASDDVRAAIASAVSGAHPLIRRLGRRMLVREHQPPDTIHIRQSGDRILIQRGSEAPRVDAPGSPKGRPVPGRPGRSYQMRWVEDALVVEVTTPQGRRVHRYRLEDDGRRLVLEVTARSGRRILREPLTYRLVYLRADTANGCKLQRRAGCAIQPLSLAGRIERATPGSLSQASKVSPYVSP